MAQHPVGTVFVEQGTVYNPGWLIVKQERTDFQRVLTRVFDTEADALEELPYYQKEYAA